MNRFEKHIRSPNKNLFRWKCFRVWGNQTLAVADRSTVLYTLQTKRDTKTRDVQHLTPWLDMCRRGFFTSNCKFQKSRRIKAQVKLLQALCQVGCPFQSGSVSWWKNESRETPITYRLLNKPMFGGLNPSTRSHMSSVTKQVKQGWNKQYQTLYMVCTSSCGLHGGIWLQDSLSFTNRYQVSKVGWLFPYQTLLGRGHLLWIMK